MNRIIIFGVISAVILVLATSWLLFRQFKEVNFTQKDIRSIEIQDDLQMK